MAEEDILAQAAGSVQQSIQGMPPSPQSPFTYGPQQMVQPPPLPQVNRDLLRPQVAQAPAGGFASSGARKRADRQSMFSNIANMVKAGGDYIESKKQRAITMDISRLIGAQQGLEEAKQSGDQEAIKRNTSIINDITSDPKKIKQLQKAFNIDLFGNGKNKAENQALIEAWKDHAKKDGDLSPQAQKLLNSQPVRQKLTEAVKAQKALIDAGMRPDANAQLNAYTNQANEKMKVTVAREQMANDLKIAEMTAGRISGEGVNVVDQDPNSLTGIMKIQQSADGKTYRKTQNVVLPSVLPSEHDGITTLTVADPNSPTGQSIARIPNPSKTIKSIPGVGRVGGGGIVQGRGTGTVQGGGTGRGVGTSTTKPKPKTNMMGVPTDGSVKNGENLATKLNLPPGSVIISPKALSPVQLEKLQEGVTTIEKTVERLKDIRQYADIYSDMFQAGKVKFVTNPKTGQRMLGSFVPSTDDEKKAAAAWQESAEYMNVFRQQLSAQGFRSIPSYDNMLALRGQLWQDKAIMKKTLDDSIDLLNKQAGVKKKLLGEAPTLDEIKKEVNKDDPAGLFSKVK